MIKYIIKRDGSREAFDAAKLNKWAIWSAAEIQGRADWSSVVTKAVKSFGEEAHSQDLQRELIKQCVRTKRWPESLMAGRLYSALMRKEIYEDRPIPYVRKLHHKLATLGLMERLAYSDGEYFQIERLIDHERDFHMSYAQVKQLRKKYALKNIVKDLEYETPQFIFMRMAMKLSENLPVAERMAQIKSYYDDFSLSRVNAPSPNYLNLGTPLRGFASCCLYTVGDSAPSLAIGDHIAYTETYMAAGIGGILQTRSIKDPVRGGQIEHLGKMNYFKAVAGAVKANTQAGRGGACTQYFSIFDPEASMILMAQNPRTAVDNQNRDIHFAWEDNRLFAKKALLNEQIFTFNVYHAPELHHALFSGDQDHFEALYAKYEADPKFVKHYVSARKLLLLAFQQRNEVGTLYRFQIDEANRHTPHKEPIYSSNLCVEITQPTKPYHDMRDLYSVDHERGEVSMCSLGGIVITNITSDAQYEESAYNTLRMIDECIHMSSYPFPHVEYTAKKRLNAGIGILGLAYHMARLNLKYDTPEGLAEIHRVAERHAYFVIKASLRLGRERGNAPWMHKTKWPEGWLPIDTYKRTVDELVSPVYQYDWEALRAEIIANGGIRNSSLIAHMPTESSSKASGAPNSVYPVRDLSLTKTDVNNVLAWVAPDNDLLDEQYQLAWEISPANQAKFYGVIQKFTDMAISADVYRDRTKTTVNELGETVISPLTDVELIEEYQAFVKYGVKSQYYNNSFTGGKKLEDVALKQADVPAADAIGVVPLDPALTTLTTTNISHERTDPPLSALDMIAYAARHQIAAQVNLPQVTLDDIDGEDAGVGCASGACAL